MNAETKTIRILTADDHALLRQGIAALVDLEPDMEMVAQASTGREAIEQFRRHRPDITLMDLQMPDISGIEAIIAIRGEFPDARIVVLTTYAGDVQVARALKAGARGYLLKGNVIRICWRPSARCMPDANGFRRRSRPSWPCIPPRNS